MSLLTQISSKRFDPPTLHEIKQIKRRMFNVYREARETDPEKLLKASAITQKQ